MDSDPVTRVAHRWDLTEAEARALQRELAGKVERADRFGDVRTVGGVDLGFPRQLDGSEVGRAALVVLRLPELKLVERQVLERPVSFPYVPGLLSFREAPVGLAAFDALAARPDVLLVDGHGIAHPRRFGIACHLGVLLDVPTVGCAKSILAGRADEPGPEPGSWTPLVHRDEVIGVALRTRPRANPMYISTGHRVSLESAIELVMRCARGYRLPEPTRLADRIASRRGGADG